MVSTTSTQTTDQTPTTAEKMRQLHWSYIRNAANTFFVQFTFFGPAFVLFLNELQLNNAQIGLLLSFFPFLGIISFFIAPSVGRYGYKRTFVSFFGARKFVTLMLLLVPWVAVRSGPQATLLYIGAIMVLFGLCRAISETAMFPWLSEMIPNSIRGRYSAVNNIIMNLTGVVAITAASWVLERPLGLSRFTFLFGAGIIFGLVAVWAATHHPGGASTRGTDAENISQKDILKSLRDTNFTTFIAGLGLVTLATTPMFSFLPLFMREQVGLSDGQVVLLQNGTLIGSLSATYLAGWAADRYGSKPVMLSGVWLMMLLPIGWLLMPRGSNLSLFVALGIALVQGIAVIMWGIGSARMLFVNIVPFDKKAEYMGIYYALVGIIGGFSQLIGGVILDVFANLSGARGIVTIDSFTPLFVLGFALLLVGLISFRFIHAESTVGTGQFAGMFLHGNPFMAFESMIRYYRARDEHTTVVMTERLGQAHSPLIIDELLEALHDPRFFVRFEAVVSIARSDPDPRYVEALTQILQGTEVSLTVMAAWALGRIGDTHAIEALRGGLDAPFGAIKAHCARALGILGDTSIVPELLRRLNADITPGLQMAYASALGSLQAQEGIKPILKLMRETENDGARMELALSLARIVGNEQEFIRLLRQMREDAGTNASQAVFALGRRWSVLRQDNAELDKLLPTCTEAFARNDLETGIQQLIQIIYLLPPDTYNAAVTAVLDECADQLTVQGMTRFEYLVLVFDLLNTTG